METKEELLKLNEQSEEIDVQFGAADKAVTRLETWLVDAEQADKIVTQEAQFKQELKLHEKKFKCGNIWGENC